MNAQPPSVVISLCDRTGNFVRPWAESGFECWCIDTQHSIRATHRRGFAREERTGLGVIRYAWGDARSWCIPPELRARLAFFAAFPVCTHLTCTCARDFKMKAGWMLTDGVQLFDSCRVAATYSGVPYLLENPATSRLNTHRLAPTHKFHPWEYAGYLANIQEENTMKLTGLWSGGGFVMPEKKPAPGPHRQDCWCESPSDDRDDLRSVTPMGFARAVFEANRPDVRTQAA